MRTPHGTGAQQVLDRFLPSGHSEVLHPDGPTLHIIFGHGSCEGYIQGARLPRALPRMGERSLSDLRLCLHACLPACAMLCMLCMLCRAVPCCSVVPDWGVVCQKLPNTCGKSLIPLVLCCAVPGRFQSVTVARAAPAHALIFASYEAISTRLTNTGHF